MQHSTILLNLEQVKAIIREGLSLNNYYILEKLSEGVPVAQIQEVQRLSDSLSSMVATGQLTQDGKVTTKGERILRDIISLGHKTLATGETKSQFAAFTEQFRELFPEILLPNGKEFKTNIRDISKKMVLFSKNYRDAEFTDEVVLEAARAYVQYAEQVNYKFIRTAAYFVYKEGEGSDLADWCSRVLRGETRNNQPSERDQHFL